MWAAKPQRDWCHQLNFSVSTLNRLIKLPPVVRETRMIDGVKVTLLRIGKPGPETPYQIARKMACIWRKHFDGRTTTEREFGCLMGLAEDWPKGKQVEIFKTIMGNWGGFMAGVKLSTYGTDAMEKDRFYRLPSISVMRRFHAVGVEQYLIEQQSGIKG